MRTFGLAVRLRPAERHPSPTDALLSVLESWYSTKSRHPASHAKQFTRESRVEERDGDTLREFTFTQAADGEGHWTTLIRVLDTARDPHRPFLTIEMSLEDVADRLAPLTIAVAAPRFLRDLRTVCGVETLDGFVAPPRVLEVSNRESAELLAAEIFDEQRKLPLVVVTDPVYERPLAHDIAGSLAEHTFALARVVHVLPRMTFTLTERLGRDLTAFDGGIRIYWPGAQPGDDRARHPLYLRRTLGTWGDDPPSIKRAICSRIAQEIIVAAAPRFRLPAPLKEFLQKLDRERIERSDASLSSVREALLVRERELADSREMEQLALAENQRVHATLNSVREELDATRKELFREREKLSHMEAALRARGSPVPTPAAEPSSAEEAIERARVDFGDVLEIPENVVVETDLGPAVYQVLKALSEACTAERSGNVKDRRKLFADALAENLGHPGRYEPGPTGLEWSIRGKSVPVKDRIHIKSGRPVDTESVYFITDGTGQSRRYVVVRIGRHA
jgi:hypothetical protein